MNKKFYTVCLTFGLLFLFSFSVRSQQIDLKDLISIYKKSMGEVDDYLSKRNYTFEEEKPYSVQGCSEYYWKNTSIITEQISITRCKDIELNSYGCAYYFENINIYNLIKSQCIQLGYSQSNTYIDNGILHIVYTNGIYKISLNSKSKEYGGGWYGVSVNKF